MPVSNVIRSTGLAGKIHITVSASGLASGSIDIETEDIKPDNSVITESVLNNTGRKKVERFEAISTSRPEEIPRELKLTYDELKFTSPDKSGYARLVREYLIKNNPSADTSLVEFKTLVDLFSTHLFNNNGLLIADDYNFSIDHFNNCRVISGYISATKLPGLFKDGLRNYYATAIIKQGCEKNAGDEMNWLNWIPSGGTVVIFNDGGKIPAVKGAVMTGKSELSELIAVVHPTFTNFSNEAKERALLFISKANPYIRISSISEHSTEGNKGIITKVTYTADKGQPILIPLLKFISE